MQYNSIQIKSISKENILEDINCTSESLISLKRSIISLGDKDINNEVYHRFCDTEDEVNNILEKVKFILRG